MPQASCGAGIRRIHWITRCRAPNPCRPTVGARQVLGRGETFVANTTAEFADVFPDHAQINALGCQAAMNLPVIAAGEVLGTINVLDQAGAFPAEKVAAVQAVIADRQAEIVAAMRAVPMA